VLDRKRLELSLLDEAPFLGGLDDRPGAFALE
jgi:hypothetical protein